MKILLVNPPWKKSDGQYGVRAGSRWPFTQCVKNEKSLDYIPFPFYIAYAAALLEKVPGTTVLAIDAIAEGLDDQAYFQKILAFAPDFILAETSTPSSKVDLRYVSETKKMLGPGARFALAGPHVTTYAETVMQRNPDVDFCFIGEYEWTLRELICLLQEGNDDVHAVQGLAYRKQDGSVIINRRRPLGNINELPFPAWHHFPMKNYKDYFSDFPAPMVNVVASRGCPYTCNFCMWPDVMYGGHQYRVRDAKNVVDEIECLINRYGFKTIYFDDDTFDIGKQRMLEICNEIQKRSLKIRWAMMARADTIDEETLRAFKQSGLHAVKYGVESGNQKILDSTGKKLNLETVKKTVALTKTLGVRVHLTFTVGLLGETAQTVRDTINLALSLDPDSLQVSICTPFPGTRYYEQARERGLLVTEEENVFDGSQSGVVRTDELSKEDIENAAREFQDIWARHCNKRRFFIKRILSKAIAKPGSVLYKALDLVRR